MLRLWTHPRTRQSRIYFAYDAVHQATRQVDGDWRCKDVKVWLESSSDGGADIHTIVKGEDAIPETRLDQFQAAILEVAGLDGREAWDELVLLAQASTDEPATNSTRYRSKRDRHQEAKKLDLAGVKLNRKIRVYISQYESELLRSLLSSHPQVAVRRADLGIADFKVEDERGNQLLIERQRCTDDGLKTDFERSLQSDGKLFEKVDRLVFVADNSDHQIVPILLLEGDVYRNSQSLSLTQIDGAISFLAGVQRISILTTIDAKHSAHMILRLAAAFLAGEMTPDDRSKGKPKALFEQKLNLLRALPGVDDITAELLLKEFGSLQELAQASAERIAEIKGIGPHKANAIARVFA